MGHAIVRDFFAKDGIQLGNNFQDCGLLLYDRQNQDMHAGASGCGCSASVLNGYLLGGMRERKWTRIVFAPTGALLSPTSSFQGRCSRACPQHIAIPRELRRIDAYIESLKREEL